MNKNNQSINTIPNPVFHTIVNPFLDHQLLTQGSSQQSKQLLLLTVCASSKIVQDSTIREFWTTTSNTSLRVASEWFWGSRTLHWKSPLTTAAMNGTTGNPLACWKVSEVVSKPSLDSSTVDPNTPKSEWPASTERSAAINIVPGWSTLV